MYKTRISHVCLISVVILFCVSICNSCSKDVDAVTLNQNEVTIEEGGSCLLVANVSPQKAPQNVTWRSSDPSVASVNESGVVRAICAGKCIITASAGECHADCRVTVSIGVKTFTVNGVTFKMMPVVHGNYTKGKFSNTGQVKASVRITKDFYLAQCEVTQALWIAVMGDNPSHFKDDLQNPVDSVSWDDCQTFIRKLNEMTNEQFRLPTECEWEYAAQGGIHQSPYCYSGSDDIKKVGWYKDNSESKTHPVGQLEPNALGIFDMTGNIFEMCQDNFDPKDLAGYNKFYTSADTLTDPLRVLQTDCWVAKGMCYSQRGEVCKISEKSYVMKEWKEKWQGFRLALTR